MRKEYVRDSIGVVSVADEMREKRLRWIADMVEGENGAGPR